MGFNSGFKVLKRQPYTTSNSTTRLTLVVEPASPFPKIATELFYVGKSWGNRNISIQTSHSRWGYGAKINWEALPSAQGAECYVFQRAAKAIITGCAQVKSCMPSLAITLTGDHYHNTKPVQAFKCFSALCIQLPVCLSVCLSVCCGYITKKRSNVLHMCSETLLTSSAIMVPQVVL